MLIAAWREVIIRIRIRTILLRKRSLRNCQKPTVCLLIPPNDSVTITLDMQEFPVAADKPGAHPVSVKLHPGVTATVPVKVVAG